MPTFTTKIYLQKADKKDALQLTSALKQRWFIEHYPGREYKTNTAGNINCISFTSRATAYWKLMTKLYLP